MAETPTSHVDTKTKNTSPFTRPLSLVERSALVFDDLSPPVINQMVLEGSGELVPERWRAAVSEASATNPGSRLVLRGFLGICRWIDCGKTPPVREADGNKWSGYGPEGAPMLRERLSTGKGPTSEVVLLHGNPSRVVFRTHHAVMDGRGTMTWAEDVFRVLRGEPTIGSSSKLTEFELAGTFQQGHRTPFPRDCLAPTGDAEGSGLGVVWMRKRIEGQYPNLFAQIAILMAKEARRQKDGNVWVMVPIDLRARQKGLRSTNNLTLSIYVEVKPDVTPKQLTADLARQIHERRDGMLDKWDHLFRYVPVWMLKMGARIETLSRLKSGRHSVSGIISHLGKINPEPYRGGGFHPERIFFIPPSFVGAPFFMVVSESGGGIDLMLSMPKVLATRSRLEESFERIVRGLMSGRV